MEGYAPKASEASGEKGAMAQGTTKSLKAAADAAASIGPHGLFAGYSAKGKADQETAASAVGRAFAMSALAAAMAQKAMEAAQQAAVLAAAAAKKSEEAKQAEAEAAKKSEEAAVSDAATDDDSEDEEGGMTSMEYILTYKQLPPFEVELFLEHPVERKLFTDSQAFKDLSADPSATQDDFEDALVEHEKREDKRLTFQQWVRSEYEAWGYVAVSDEYIAMRARTEELSSKLWKEVFADFGREEDDDEEVASADLGDEEEGEQENAK